ncbi:hypothetical protein [Cecembia rubra]|uniref:Uncharacterized protein n=1 Tax=Cecembia rubra TaxID=1485585 RepID=A0A2P8E335_9BACT|nr:hypothetical protein [Cecembia rubra]PSL03875.1 hypothetical protein CLV48_106115 [Cecembia rubra]
MIDIRNILESEEINNGSLLEEFFIKEIDGGLKSKSPYKTKYFEDEIGFSELIQRELKSRNSKFSKRLVEAVEFDLNLMIEDHKKLYKGRNTDLLELADRFKNWLMGSSNQFNFQKEPTEKRTLENVLKEPSNSNFRKIVEILLLKNAEISLDHLKPLIDVKLNWVGNKGAVQVFGEILINKKIVIETKKSKLGRILSNTFHGVKEKCMEQGNAEKYGAKEYEEYFLNSLKDLSGPNQLK